MLPFRSSALVTSVCCCVGNIQLIANIVKKIFCNNQALCVSHHSQFHGKDFHSLRTTIVDGKTNIN